MDESLSRAHVSDWIEDYEQVWRTPGTDALASIFTEDASYSQGPYQEPVLGLADIGRMWEEAREGAAEPFTMTSSIGAVEGDTAVVRVEVHYAEPSPHEYRDLWVMRFAPDGRCREYEEWPFAPEQRITM